jgi:hypothetical protein
MKRKATISQGNNGYFCLYSITMNHKVEDKNGTTDEHPVQL